MHIDYYFWCLLQETPKIECNNQQAGVAFDEKQMQKNSTSHHVR